MEAMVRKDINHPSVIMYSIGNEIPEVGSRRGAAGHVIWQRKSRSLDSTRFVTSGVQAMLAVRAELFASIAEHAGATNAQETSQRDVNNARWPTGRT